MEEALVKKDKDALGLLNVARGGAFTSIQSDGSGSGSVTESST